MGIISKVFPSRRCIECREEFTPRRYNQKYCSLRCKFRFNTRLKRLRYPVKFIEDVGRRQREYWEMNHELMLKHERVRSRCRKYGLPRPHRRREHWKDGRVINTSREANGRFITLRYLEE